VIQQIIETGVAQLETLDGEIFGGILNGGRLKIYREGQWSKQ
jgi:hypothetical protein